MRTFTEVESLDLELMISGLPTVKRTGERKYEIEALTHVSRIRSSSCVQEYVAYTSRVDDVCMCALVSQCGRWTKTISTFLQMKAPPPRVVWPNQAASSPTTPAGDDLLRKRCTNAGIYSGICVMQQIVLDTLHVELTCYSVETTTVHRDVSGLIPLHPALVSTLPRLLGAKNKHQHTTHTPQQVSTSDKKKKDGNPPVPGETVTKHRQR